MFGALGQSSSRLNRFKSVVDSFLGYNEIENGTASVASGCTLEAGLGAIERVIYPVQ